MPTSLAFRLPPPASRLLTLDTLHLKELDVKQLPLPPPFAPGVSAVEAVTIYTIGHSNHDAETFLALLRRHGLKTIVDVRSAPYSRYAPNFNRNALAALLDAAGIAYVWAGDALGGRPDDPACYHDGIVRLGNVDYVAMALRPSYHAGLADLLGRAPRHPTAVMCSEEDPRRCHRHRLLEPSLRDLGANVRHIRGDGSLEEIDPAETDVPETPSPQLALMGFGE